MNIKCNLKLKYRDKPERHTKYEVSDRTANHLVKTEKKKLYDYYICDYCGEEIKIVKEKEKRTRGLGEISRNFN